MAELDTDVRYLRGVGPKRAEAFAKLDINTIRDLLEFFPRAYEDRRALKNLADISDGEYACARVVASENAKLTHVRRGLDLVKCAAFDDTGNVAITFFNQSYLKDSIKVGEEYIIYGKFAKKRTKLEITNPAFETSAKAGTSTMCILPVYHLTAGLTQKAISAGVRQGLDECAELLEEPLPVKVRTENNLASVRFAYENIHFPKEMKELELARRRMVFEELFTLTCAMGTVKKSRVEASGRKLAYFDICEFTNELPFKLTGAQTRAIEDAFSDMTSGRTPMSRLVQGDVGSGKTVVAAACCWLCAKNRCQSAVMAPTEILAAQHYDTFSKMLEPFGITVLLLTGSMTAKQKRLAGEMIASGKADVIIGTHALLTGSVEFNDLAFAACDEQHRFGVQQRAALIQKGERPHILVMSATPIPRTLALIIYGELDVSVIDELPPGRQKVDTFAVGESMRARINAFIEKHVKEGRQVYVVCPMVEESEEETGLVSAEAHAKMLAQVFPQFRVGLIHGKLKASEKERVMNAFSSGEIDILVSTTVIEVGVDVPNATLMIVENAERFGLSQLHQLRGRVGRGQHKSYCILFGTDVSETAKERLDAMCKTNDGFKIAETDLKLRGPGDFFGSRQHGLPETHIASFADDMDVLMQAQNAAQKLLNDDPELTKPENIYLKRKVDKILAHYSDSMN